MMKAKPECYPCEVHAKFELGQEVKHDTSLVIQNSQVFLLMVLCVCGLVAGIQGFWAAGLSLLLSLLAKTQITVVKACKKKMLFSPLARVPVIRLNMI